MNPALQELIDQQRAESFEPGADVSDAKVLGTLISRHLDFDAWSIVEAAVSALVDANAHVLAARLQARARAMLGADG